MQYTKCHCAELPEDEQVMLETCRGPWFLINWIKCASRWFHCTDILWCTVNKTLSKWKNSLVHVSTGTSSDAQSIWVMWGKQQLVCRSSYVTVSVLHQTRTAIPHQVSSRSHLIHVHIPAMHLTWLYLPTEQTAAQPNTLHMLHSDKHISENLLIQVMHKFLYMYWMLWYTR
jgi:hypothetical protein